MERGTWNNDHALKQCAKIKNRNLVLVIIYNRPSIKAGTRNIPEHKKKIIIKIRSKLNKTTNKF